MIRNSLKVHPDDNVIVALCDLKAGDQVSYDGTEYNLVEDVGAKHKFVTQDLAVGDVVRMYGVIVGRAVRPISKGGRISTENIVHATTDYQIGKERVEWKGPDVSSFVGRTFMGYHRPDGKVGTLNYWLVIPLVFCENRNLETIEASMLEQLGYATDRDFIVDTQALIDIYKKGGVADDILSADIILERYDIEKSRLFKNVDGIKFLRHDGGCGAIDQDIETLCRLLASYIVHPNVAGTTILSLGCQKAQYDMLENALKEMSPSHRKPMFFLEQQQSKSERHFISDAVKQTFIGLLEADKVKREPAPISKLVIGLECGGSDGFSGLSANPTLGHTSDMLIKLGGATVLSEFPELNGVQQELINRCTSRSLAEKFKSLMESYHNIAFRQGSGFEDNPSPGNVKEGLITDAMKSAGAAKKGGTSPITDVLDYTELVTKPGLNLLCTPGSDVESTTGLASAGSNIILFTTGLGTPTGNPVVPVIKVSTNNALYERMSDIIDFNTGNIITGVSTIEDKGEALLDYIIEVASGLKTPAAVRLGQDDFIPWKRGISL
jgi:altronate hydrolase